MNKRIKVLLAQFPLETHSRGIITVAGMLKDAGMEVVLIGNELPENIITTAVQEDADVVAALTSLGYSLREATQAVSSLSASNMDLEEKVRMALQQLAKGRG